MALALGSGGARGYAHIGVIEALVARGYDIVGVSGSSMGALVGGLQAAGRLDEFADWAKSLTQRTILRLLDPSISAAGVMRAGKILDAVRDILGPVAIEDLPIPYTAVATDLLAGKSVWFQRGPLDEAIRASIAIPGVIAPHAVDGRLLADGGILDPLPLAPLAAVNADLTIAVSLSGSEAISNREPEPGATVEWLTRMVRSTSALLDTAAARSLLDRPTARAVHVRVRGRRRGRALGDQPLVAGAGGELGGVDQVPVVPQRNPGAGRGVPEDRLRVFPGGVAGGRVAAVADSDVARHGAQRLLVEHLADQAEVLEDQHLGSVGDGDACGFLAAMLQRVQAVIGEFGDVLARGPHPEYTAFFTGCAEILFGLLDGHD